LDEEVEVGAHGVLGAELDVVRVAERELHGLARLLQALLARDAELAAQVDVRGRDEDVDARLRGRLERLGRALAVAARGAREGCPERAPYLLAGLPHRLGVFGRARRETRLEDVDPERGELVGEAELLRGRHATARRLLPVSQRRVE